MPQVLLKELAYARSGDKGDVCNIGVMAKSHNIYEFLVHELTPEKIRSLFKGGVKGEVEIYPMPNLESVQVVLRRSLGGGATCTLRFDQTGKSMCCALLRMPLEVGDELAEEANEATENIMKRYRC